MKKVRQKEQSGSVYWAGWEKHDEHEFGGAIKMNRN